MNLPRLEVEESRVMPTHTCIIPQDLAMDVGFTNAPGTIGTLKNVLGLCELYILIISQWAESERLEAIQQPLIFILPLLEVYANRFHAVAASHYHTFLSERGSAEGTSGFESFWTPVRDALVDATLPFDAFTQYDSCHADGAVQKTSKLQKLSKRFDVILRKATRMEQHMRDEMQLQVGHLSLQESKESIKQSKIAIEESKRVKMRMWTTP
jgi:hypothetical protein